MMPFGRSTRTSVKSQISVERKKPSIDELRRSSHPCAMGRTSDVVQRDLLPDVRGLFSYWENMIYKTNSLSKSHVVRTDVNLVRNEGVTRLQDNVITFNPRVIMTCCDERLDSLIVHELVHARLHQILKDHARNTHDEFFIDERNRILQEWKIDIGDDERKEWPLLRQAQVYKYMYFDWVCRKCGYSFKRLNNSAEPDGWFFGYHEVDAERCIGSFALLCWRDYRPPKSPVSRPPLSPGKKRTRKRQI